jgi:hypothetical protein
MDKSATVRLDLIFRFPGSGPTCPHGAERAESLAQVYRLWRILWRYLRKSKMNEIEEYYISEQRYQAGLWTDGVPNNWTSFTERPWPHPACVHRHETMQPVCGGACIHIRFRLQLW